MRYKPKSIAALHIALGGLPDKDAGRGGARHRSVSKDRWRTSEGDGVARELGDLDPGSTPSRKLGKGEQGSRKGSRFPQAVGRSSHASSRPEVHSLVACLKRDRQQAWDASRCGKKLC